jgi:hypothetical protein
MVAKVGILHACELVKLPATEGIRSNLTLQKVDPLPQRSIFGHLLHRLDPQFPILLLAGVWLSAAVADVNPLPPLQTRSPPAN